VWHICLKRLNPPDEKTINGIRTNTKLLRNIFMPQSYETNTKINSFKQCFPADIYQFPVF
ncbi:MAG: hypothetical protein RB294_11060, partial [Bacteroidales bacterium]|nr:hypothetical protein [Bacteroidales bacterium]